MGGPVSVFSRQLNLELLSLSRAKQEEVENTELVLWDSWICIGILILIFT